jgi:YidC/Oxa1 family membrane protein insertase
MDKRTTIAFILIGVILVFWLYMNSPEPQPPVTNKSDSTQAATDTSVKVEKQKQREKASEPAPNLQSSAAASESAKNENPYVTPDKEEQIINIETDFVKLELTSKGARIRKYYLKKYNTWYYRDIDSSNFYDRHVQLINNDDGGDFNLVFVTKNGQLINTKDVDFSSNADNYEYKISGDDSLAIQYTFEVGEGHYVKKTYIIHGNSYSSTVNIEMDNMNDVISSYRYDVVWNNGINFVERNSVDEARYSSAGAYSGGELVEIDASSPDEKETKDINGQVDWVSVKNKYFAVIIAPKNPSPDGGAYFEGTNVNNPKYGTREYYSASLKIPFQQLNYQKDSFRLYIGPLEFDRLKELGNNYDAIYDFGSFLGLRIFRPISEYILLPLFQFLHRFIPNYGFVIVIFTLIIKFALYPLTKQSYKSMRKMQLLQPKIKEMKEKYKDDPQRVQKETMKLYSTYGINPAGGCLPMLLQMPILIALYSLFNVAIQIRLQPFILWITNLSSPDVILSLPFKIPIFGIDNVSGLALLLGITMFLQQKMSVQDPSQKAMVYIMPVMFTLMFMGFPSGLNLYYFMFNLFSIMQQYYVGHHKTAGEELVPVKDPKKKKGGFMQRMMEAAEKQQQAQKQAGKKKKKF